MSQKGMEIFEHETYSVQTKPMQRLGKFLKRKTKINNSKYVKKTPNLKQGNHYHKSHLMILYITDSIFEKGKRIFGNLSFEVSHILNRIR